MNNHCFSKRIFLLDNYDREVENSLLECVVPRAVSLNHRTECAAFRLSPLVNTFRRRAIAHSKAQDEYIADIQLVSSLQLALIRCGTMKIQKYCVFELVPRARKTF